MIPQVDPFLKWAMLDFLRMLSLIGGDKVKDIIFRQEIISLPGAYTKNDQTLPTITIENDHAPNIKQEPTI